MKIIINKVYTKIFFSVLSLSLLASCSPEKLEPSPTIFFSDLVVFNTPERISQQVNNLYSSNSIKNGGFLGGRFFVYSDIRGEDFINVKANASTGLGVWNFTTVESSSEPENIWRYGYASINQANVLLKGLDDNAAKFVAPVFPADFATKVNQYKGEARFVRAVAYFYMLQFYSKSFGSTGGTTPGLPLRLNAESSSEGNDMARSTVAEVYATILSDLNFAEANLPLDYGNALTNVVHAHRNTAIAFKTKVYLAMSKWNELITEATKIVPAAAPFVAATGVKHALQPSVLTVFTGAQTSLESIFSMTFSTQDAPGIQNAPGGNYLPAGGEYYLNPLGLLVDAQWKTTDARRQMLTTSGGNQWLTKFPTPTPYTDKLPVIRYAEVLLNLAEARVRSTNTVDALAIQLLNAVHGRSDATTQWTAANFANADALIAVILKERRIEFMGEGIRSLDIMRLNMPFPAKGNVPSVAPTDPNYLFPIPASELRSNSLMTRN